MQKTRPDPTMNDPTMFIIPFWNLIVEHNFLHSAYGTTSYKGKPVIERMDIKMQPQGWFRLFSHRIIPLLGYNDRSIYDFVYTDAQAGGL